MKKALIILSILAAAFAAFIVIFPEKNPLKKWLNKPTTDDPNAATPPALGVPNSPGKKTPLQEAEIKQKEMEYRLGFPLTKGSKGTYVTAIQKALNKKYNTNLEVDGIFGQKTYRALSVNGFNPDSVSYSDYYKIIDDGIRY